MAYVLRTGYVSENAEVQRYACGYGAHGNVKYHRAKSKRAWKAQMQKEGASWGSFLIVGYVLRGVYGFSVRSSSY